MYLSKPDLKQTELLARAEVVAIRERLPMGPIENRWNIFEGIALFQEETAICELLQGQKAKAERTFQESAEASLLAIECALKHAPVPAETVLGRSFAREGVHRALAARAFDLARDIVEQGVGTPLDSEALEGVANYWSVLQQVVLGAEPAKHVSYLRTLSTDTATGVLINDYYQLLAVTCLDIERRDADSLHTHLDLALRKYRQLCSSARGSFRRAQCWVCLPVLALVNLARHFGLSAPPVDFVLVEFR
ncbi:MAG: hypothetical protein HY376_04270 [Candidatus Blackburnbacteria bacterium]|nr:hypothetical protein [Candidatus Blackburnbacteria bacterium]